VSRRADVVAVAAETGTRPGGAAAETLAMLVSELEPESSLAMSQDK
jgi:hypothetical protein